MPTILIRGLEVGVILQQQLSHVNITPCCSIAERSPISKTKEDASAPPDTHSFGTRRRRSSLPHLSVIHYFDPLWRFSSPIPASFTHFVSV